MQTGDPGCHKKWDNQSQRSGKNVGKESSKSLLATMLDYRILSQKVML